MPINKNEITIEQIKKAMQCKDADELMALVKAEGFEMTKEEAEAYLDEMGDYELDEEALRKVAGGECYVDINQLKDCPSDCTMEGGVH